MTHIRLVHPPFEHIKPERSPFPAERSGKTSAGTRTLVAFSVLMTAANLAGIAYTAVLVKKLSDFSGEIDKVSQFEQRVSARLGTFNDGIHAQFDRLNATLTGSTDRMGNTPESSTSKRRPFYHVSALLLDNAQKPQTYQHLSTLTPTGGANEESPGGVLQDQPGLGGNVGSSTRIANFLRTETPDGKVIYRTIE